MDRMVRKIRWQIGRWNEFIDISGNNRLIVSNMRSNDSWTSSTRVHASPPAITILVTLRLVADNPLPSEPFPMVKITVKNGKVLKVRGSFGNTCINLGVWPCDKNWI